MRIVFRTSGGFAAIPALSAPLTVDVRALPPAEQEEWRQLVERTAFFELPSSEPRPELRDARRYTITIDDEGRTHTVTLTDPVPAGDLRVLVDRLRWHAAARRALRREGSPPSSS
jgi:hypothetical protein